MRVIGGYINEIYFIKKKKYFIIIFSLCLCFIAGIGVSYLLFKSDAEMTINPDKNNSVYKSSIQEQDNLIKQEDFDSWVRDISNTEITGYEFKSNLSNFGLSARAMNKELSFNKREILTSTGEIDFGVDSSTEKTIAYISGTKTFTVAFMRNEKNINDDFQGSDWLYTTQDNVYCVPLIMTYKNMIILTTLQDTDNYVDYFEAIELSKLIIKGINNNSI